MESLPLWVWAIIVGAIIASKFIYGWQTTKQFAKEDQERKTKANSNDWKNKTSEIIMRTATEDIAQNSQVQS